MKQEKKLSTKDMIEKVGHATAKGKAILKEIEENSTGWRYISGEHFKDHAVRQYQCGINGHICCHDINTPKDKDGKWMTQENKFSLLIEPGKVFDHIFDLYDYAMTLPKGKAPMIAPVHPLKKV